MFKKHSGEKVIVIEDRSANWQLQAVTAITERIMLVPFWWEE